MNSAMSGSCEPADDELDTGEVDPAFRRGERSLEVFAQAPVAVEPGQRALDHPAAG